eukprot:4474009-Lingulodinium_polyedra.AAC.1
MLDSTASLCSVLQTPPDDATNRPSVVAAPRKLHVCALHACATKLRHAGIVRACDLRVAAAADARRIVAQ